MKRSSKTPTAGRPERVLGFWSATALVVASMLGTGVFTTSGFLMADLGSPWRVLAAWGLGGVVALLGALSYGTLGREIPESGGEYLFLSRTLHPAAGCMAGWVSLLVGFSAPLAAAGYAFGEYTSDWFPGVPPALTGSLLIVALSGLHAWDTRLGATAQNLGVLLKLVLVAAFIVLGALRLQGLQGPAPGVAAGAGAMPFSGPAFAMALVWVSFSYAGWNAVIYLGSEVSDPERTIPRSLLAGTLLVTALYLALNAVFVLAVPGEVIAGKLQVGRLVAAQLGGRAWEEGTTVLIVVALLTLVSSLVMTGPRVYARIAADGYLPRWLEQGSGPPRAAILLQLAIALGMLWASGYEAMLTFVGFALSLSSAATVAGLMVLRIRRGPSLRVPGWPWVPGLFVLSVLAMTALSVSRAPGPSLAGLGVLALGWGVWRFGGRSRRGNPSARDPDPASLG